MGRILGKVEYGSGIVPRYFIHCDIAGHSFTPLFLSADTAWGAYEVDSLDGIYSEASCDGAAVRIIRKSLSLNNTLEGCAVPSATVCYGFASYDRLLTPIEEVDEEKYSLLRRDGIMHVAVEGHNILGMYNEPVCSTWWTPSPNDEHFALQEFYGTSIMLCSQCLARLLR